MAGLLNLIIGAIKAIVAVCLSVLVIAGCLSIIVALFAMGSILVPICIVGFLTVMIYFSFNEPPP